MAIHIYDTLSRTKVPLVPRVPGELKVYVCGPTVYDLAHIGHARVYVAFDTIVRHLRRTLQVTYVRNFTDIDDKILRRAAEVQEAPLALSARFIAAFRADMATLGVLPPDHEPQVSHHMEAIIGMIGTLIAQKHAYTAGGDVCFAVEGRADYGRLGRRTLEDMEAGARVEVAAHKRHPMDFVLWKAAKPGELSWPAPWGAGRPGWHIECSAMSAAHLGPQIDLHGGGRDLIFPHHENELAQSEAAHACPLANIWMHAGLVNVDNQKMSKSLGNFFTVRTVLERFSPATLRLYLLSTHYRSPIAFSDAALAAAEARLKYMLTTLSRAEAAAGEGPAGPPYRQAGLEELGQRFAAAMDDDFNTPAALGELSLAFRTLNDVLDRPQDAAVDAHTLRHLCATLRSCGAVLGLFEGDLGPPLATLSRRAASPEVGRIEALVAARQAARLARDFARADALRAELAGLGIAVKDGPGGTTWERL